MAPDVTVETRGSPARSPARAAAEAGLSIVVPVFNEARGPRRPARPHRRGRARGSRQRAASRPRWSMSTTAAATTRSRSRARLPADALDVQVVSLSRNFGKEAALLAGLDHARLGAVLFMDGDGQHPPTLVETLVGHWLDDGYDVVYTAKAHRENEPWLRRFGVQGVLRADQLGRAPEDPGGCRRLPPAVAARGRGAAADAGAQPLLQGARELDRLPPDPRRLRAGRAHPRPHQLEPVLADRPVDRGADLVLGRAAAAREPARPAARRRRAACSACRS